MYPRPDGSPVQTQPVSGQKKVDVVCDALRSTMESMGPNKSVILRITSKHCMLNVKGQIMSISNVWCLSNYIQPSNSFWKINLKT